MLCRKSKFLWQLCHRALPSRGTLLRRGIHLDPLCPACNTDLEDTDHIFLQCPMAQKVWEMAVAHQWLRSIPFAHSMSTLQAGLQLLAHHPQPQLSRIVLLLWSMWKSRNGLIFRNEAPPRWGLFYVQNVIGQNGSCGRHLRSSPHLPQGPTISLLRRSPLITSGGSP